MATKVAYWDNTPDTDTWCYNTVWVAQTFSVSEACTIYSIKIRAFRAGSPVLTVGIYETSGGEPTGSDIGFQSINAHSWTEDGDGVWYEIVFDSPVYIAASTTYAMVFLTASSSRIYFKAVGGYANGMLLTSTDSGSTWTDEPTIDINFEVWGNTPTGENILDKFYSRKLVAAANNRIYYESSLGNMTLLSASVGGIITIEPITITEAYQKLFIANTNRLRVADFKNTKITTTDIGANPPDFATILTGETSGASMVVDYINSLSGACTIYGYRTTIATFSSGETVTGTDYDGNAISFDISADETAPPHWYSMAVFGNDSTTNGTLPSKAMFNCLYRGRLVWAGDVNNPHQWYMSKVGNPFKYLYDFTNDGDLSAVSYSNTKVGEIGDIITALIPYKDDLLIFGCANSIWALFGDPLGSGQIIKVTEETGIYGNMAWCMDDRGNLYFLGSDGIYKLPISETISQPENISKLSLPNLMTDWDLDKSLHRVVLTFDPVHNGIIISKTLLNGGTNKNYWFDLKLQGFFPETYPEECGIYSSHYYKSTDKTYTRLLLGTMDGYLREFLDSEKDDDIGDTNEAISSYVVLPIKLIAENEDKEGKLLWLNGVTAGGASGGDFLDSDSVDWSIYVGDDAETVLEDIKDGAIAFATGSWDGTGKQNKSRVKARGSYLGIKLANSTEDETWAINKVFGEIKSVGRLK